jgi:hypothetical protein
MVRGRQYEAALGLSPQEGRGMRAEIDLNQLEDVRAVGIPRGVDAGAVERAAERAETEQAETLQRELDRIEASASEED